MLPLIIREVRVEEDGAMTLALSQFRPCKTQPLREGAVAYAPHPGVTISGHWSESLQVLVPNQLHFVSGASATDLIGASLAPFTFWAPDLDLSTPSLGAVLSKFRMMNTINPD